MKTINERVYFYLNGFINQPFGHNPGCYLENLNGLLRNVLKYTEDERTQFIYHTHKLIGEKNERQQHSKTHTSKV